MDPPPPSGPPAPPRRPLTLAGWFRHPALRLLAPLLVLVIVVVALSSMHLNYDVFVPGEAPSAEARVTIGAEVQHRAGSIHLLTVGVYYGVRLPQLIGAKLNPRDAIYSENAYPDDAGAETVAMDTSQHDGAVAAFGEIDGYQNLKIDGLLVVAVDTQAPAGKLLQPGDVIASGDGQPLTTSTAASELQDIVQSHSVGQKVHLTVVRSGKTLPEDVEVIQNPSPSTSGSPASPARVIGVQIEPDYVLPVPVKIDAGSIGGPSAGLSWALSIVNLLGPNDLTRGRVIADTGTMDYQGNVGAIGGIQQKVYGAESVGATILICPAGQNYTDALATVAKSHYKMKVVGVTTLHQAVMALTAP